MTFRITLLREWNKMLMIPVVKASFEGKPHEKLRAETKFTETIIECKGVNVFFAMQTQSN